MAPKDLLQRYHPTPLHSSPLLRAALDGDTIEVLHTRTTEGIRLGGIN